MSNEEKVNTTLREVIGESVNSQAQKKSDDNSFSHTDSGAKQKEMVAGIDVSDIPDNMTKSEFKEFLAKKGKLVDDGATAKFREIAEYKKERDEIIKLGVTPQKAREIILESIRNSDNKKEAKQEIKREIDALKDEAPDPETRRGVERLEKVVKELAIDSPAYKELKKEIDDMKKALGYVQNKTVQSRVDFVTQSLEDLKGKKFDSDFIERIKDKVIEDAKKYPDTPINKIIQVVSDPDEYDEALLKTKKQEQTKENRIKEKINANDSASSGVTGSTKQFDVKKSSLKDTILHAFTQK